MKRAWVALLLCACGGRPDVTGTVEIAGSDSAAGVLVRVLDEAGDSAVTAADGRFSFPAGATVLLTAEDVTPRSVTLVRAEKGAVVRFTAVGTIAGTARRGGMPKGNTGVAVSLVGSGASVVAGDSGEYALEVPAGTHVVTARAPGFGEARSSEVVVARGAKVDAGPLILPLVGFGFTGTLAGRVTRVGAQDHGGVQVLVEGAGRTTQTAADGSFRLEEVPEGSYTLVFSYGGLGERVPNVVVTRGADGFIIDQSLYRLGEKPITLMAATRIDSGRMALSPARPPIATWLASDLLQTEVHVRWATAAVDEAREAGRVSTSSDRTSPELSPDAAWVVWSPKEGILSATSTADGSTRVLSEHYRRAVAWDGSRHHCPISAGGQVAYEVYLEGNKDALFVSMLGTDAPATQLHAWGDATSWVSSARFQGEALVAMTDVYEYTGTLRWWKPGEPERVLASDAYTSSFLYSDPTRRYFEVNDRGYSRYTLFDLEAGTAVHSRGWGANGVFSSDSSAYAFNEGQTTKLLTLPAGTETKVTDDPQYTRACVTGSTVVGVRSNGSVVAFENGQARTLVPPAAEPNRYRTVSLCAGGYVYFSEYNSLEPNKYTLGEVPLLGGAVVTLATGNVSYYSAEVRNGKVWFLTGARTVGSYTYGQLWAAVQGQGNPVAVRDDVRLYPKLFTASPTGQHLAFLALDGLYVFDPGDAVPTPKRVATGVDDVQWVGADQLVFTVPPPAAPFSFQGGVYFARPYR